MNLSTLQEMAMKLLEARKNASLGPWEKCSTKGGYVSVQQGDGLGIAINLLRGDASFIAQAANDVPTLCDAVLKLIEVVKVQREALKNIAAEHISLDDLRDADDLTEVGIQDTAVARKALRQCRELLGEKEDGK